MTLIVKIGLAVVRDGRLLLVRKEGKPSFILPGGKPEGDENDIEALEREIGEELGCGIEVHGRIDDFHDRAADLPGVEVCVRLYQGNLTGNPSPQGEIAEMLWHPLEGGEPIALAPSLARQIIPRLRQLPLERAIGRIREAAEAGVEHAVVSTHDLQAILRAADAGRLAECCAEIQAWHRTGVYQGAALQALAAGLPNDDSEDAIRRAETKVVRDAIGFVAAFHPVTNR